jgi:hypothetical protein
MKTLSGRRRVRRRLEHNTRETLRGALNRSQRTRRPRRANIDWPRTIQANLRHYQPHRTIVPETLVGHTRLTKPRAQLDHLLLCVDQSGSISGSSLRVSPSDFARWCAVVTDNVTVDSQRDPRVRVSQLPLHHSRSCTGFEQRTSRPVTHRMKSPAGYFQRAIRGLPLRRSLLFGDGTLSSCAN